MGMLDDRIEELAQSAAPRYIHTYEKFEPGKTPVYYSGPYWDHRETAAAIKAILTGKWVTTGEYVHRFEAAFGRRFNTKYNLMVNSGSSANLVMIAAMKKFYGWKDGDEVIVSPVGFPTTIAPLVQNGLKPVFVDIEMETLNFHFGNILKEITPRTRAIFVSPVLGNPPQMDHLEGLAMECDLILIGDNCDSMGSKWRGKHLGDFYSAWSTSFYPAHHISTGEGGMVSSNNEELIDIARSFAWWGRACYCVGSANLLACGTCGKRFDKWLDGYDGIVDHKYMFENMGYNLKPLDLQGAIGLVQLEKLDEIEKKRRYHFGYIGASIESKAPYDIFRVAESHQEANPVWFGVPIVCNTQRIKESLVAHLEANKIQTRSYFAGNILLHPGYKHLGNASLYPNANKALSHVFFVGVNPAFTPEVLEYINKVILEWKL